MMHLMVDIDEEDVSFRLTLKRFYETIKDDDSFVAAVKSGFSFSKISQKTSPEKDLSFLLLGKNVLDHDAVFVVNDNIMKSIESKQLLVEYFEKDVKECRK